jgi:hypothetical protein
MAIGPAAGLGLLFVFLVGFGVTYAILGILEEIAKRRMHPTLYRGTLKTVGSDYLTENAKEKISSVGGGIAVVLVVILMIQAPREWTALIWYGLTAIGILVGISTFFLFRS